MGVYTLASSALQGPSVPINDNIKLHRLFERNENAYPDCMAIINGGMYNTIECRFNVVQQINMKT